MLKSVAIPLRDVNPSLRGICFFALARDWRSNRTMVNQRVTPDRVFKFDEADAKQLQRAPVHHLPARMSALRCRANHASRFQYGLVESFREPG
jgi:hypothetical protein